jgi:hypothetical protein
MKATNDLFMLIKSLSQSEKRYFAIFASKHVIGEKNNYMKLFDSIDRQNSYDEDVLKRQFNGEKFIEQLSVTKNYLYNLILKSLSSYNSGKNVVSNINELLEHTEILYSKELVSQSKKQLAKAKQIAYRYEKFNHVLEIIHVEKVIRNKELHTDTYVNVLDEVLNEESEILAKIKNINEYYNLTSKIYILCKVADIRSESELEEFNKIIQNPLFQDETKALSYRARLLQLDALALYYRAAGDLENVFEMRKKLLTLCEEHGELVEEAPYRDAHAIINYLVSCHMIHKYDDFLPNLEKLKEITEARKTKTQNIPIVISVLTHEIGYYMYTLQFEEGEKIVRKIESELSTIKESDYNILILYLYYNISMFYFSQGKFSQSLNWLNKVLNCKYDNDSDVYYISKIISLLIHFDLENYDLLEYSLISTYRFLYKRKRVYKFEEILLDFVKKTFKVNNKNELIALFKELNEKMLELKKDRFEKRIFEEFDIITWLESKIQNKNYAEVYKEKYVKEIAEQ